MSQGGGGRQSLDGTRVTTLRNTQVKSLLLERALVSLRSQVCGNPRALGLPSPISGRMRRQHAAPRLLRVLNWSPTGLIPFTFNPM